MALMASRPTAGFGKTRPCPHCKSVILESASICPGCNHHLRFGSDAKNATPPVSALKIEGTLEHPPGEAPWEYCVMISVRDERGKEVARQVVNAGALMPSEKRTFSLSVDVVQQDKAKS